MAKTPLTTPRQKSYAMQLWRKLRAKHPDLEEADRRALIREITGGRADSLVQMRRVGEFTTLIARLKLLLDPADLHSQVRAIQMPRLNLLSAIQLQVRKLAHLVAEPEAYLRAILFERFGTRQVDALSDKLFARQRKADIEADLVPAAVVNDSELQMLRMTLHARVQTLARQAGLSEHDLRAKAGIPCDCAHCAKLPATRPSPPPPTWSGQSCPPPPHSPHSPAPTGRPIPAQGNALGSTPKTIKAL